MSTLAATWAGCKSTETHKAVNSRLDDVIQRVEKASFAEGVPKGEMEGKNGK